MGCAHGACPPALCCSAHAGAGRLAQGNLEVTEAVVLQQLQAVSHGGQSKSLLPENTGKAAGGVGHEEHTRYGGHRTH